MKITNRAALIFLAALVCLSFWAFSASAQIHADFLAGPSLWGDTQNSNEVEANSDPGAAFILSLCYGAGRYLDICGEGGYHYNGTHGENGDDAQSKGDGDGHIGSGTLNLWPGYDITDDLRVYAGGGVGLGYARFRGEGDFALAYQAGLGGVYRLTGAWSAHAGYRYLRLGDTEHDGLKAEYDSHSVLIGGRYEF